MHRVSRLSAANDEPPSIGRGIGRGQAPSAQALPLPGATAKSVAGLATVDDRADDEAMSDDEVSGDGKHSDADRLTERFSGPILAVAPAPPAPPPGFEYHVYEHEWTIGRSRAAVWAWLCDPETFTDGQIPPFRVEFLTDASGRTGFTEGVYNAHVGPLMSFSGVLGTIIEERYRDLQYFYGSYAVSHALFRPTRLQFWLADGPSDESCVLRLRLDTFVRRRAVGAWELLMRLFWKRFGHWGEKAIPNNWLR
ncbi:MAG: hypothetical protein ACJAXA_002240 [Candidatus Aldehydirespiratoraceae bacterium]|jgi:hypothetical protein